jgi:hypothetical protein
MGKTPRIQSKGNPKLGTAMPRAISPIPLGAAPDTATLEGQGGRAEKKDAKKKRLRKTPAHFLFTETPFFDSYYSLQYLSRDENSSFLELYTPSSVQTIIAPPLKRQKAKTTLPRFPHATFLTHPKPKAP